MRWNKSTRLRRLQIVLPLFVLSIFALALLLSGSPSDRHLSVYSNAANFTVAVEPNNGLDYVGLLESLEPLGTVSAKASGKHWKFRCNDVEGEFSVGKTRAKVHGSDFDLPAPFLLENGRGLVPLSSLATLLPRFLGGPVTLHDASLRLFIGDAAVHFTAQISKTTPPTLVMNFTSPVNPTIATEPGRVRMTFTREPLVSPGSQSLTFDNKTIPSAIYQESNGAAEVIVAGTVPLMASFSNGNRTITVTSPSSTAPPIAHPSPAQAPNAPPAASISVAGVHRYFAVIDPAHGGDERGAALNDELAEKDVTLSFARHLRQELQSRHLSVLLLRDSDATINLDQRASLANAAHAAIYISIHASSDGSGIRIFTALDQAAPTDSGPFIPWESANAPFLMSSRSVAGSLGSALQSRQVPARIFPAPLRPLNNITAPAIAIELAPASENPAQVNSAVYQQAIAAVVAGSLDAIQNELEAVR
jgi:N-acetylmuramoyl-L-alanine amidase